MTDDKDLAAAANALMNWFKSQNISPTEAIPILAVVLGHAINHLGADKPGGKVVGQMIVDLLNHDEK